MESFKSVLFVVCVLSTAAVTYAAECHGAPSPSAQPNMYPIWTGEPRFVRSVKNAKLYQIGQGDDIVSVVHLWGSAYEKGYAQGELMRDEANLMLNATYNYFLEQVEEAINGSVSWLPPAVVQLAAEIGLDALLDLTYDATVSFTGQYFYDEMRGLADASGVDYNTIRRIHMIGELTKASCSMYGAWGAATASLDGKLMQLRALDWSIDGPFQNFPQLTVYHSTDSSQGYSFINIGWTGWIGSITGVSSNQLAISEIGASFPDSTFGNESRIGIPFTNLLRDVLQFDVTLEDSVNRISNAHRTCDLILGVGDGKSKSFRGIEYSYSVANFYDDTNMMPIADWHPRIKNVVYYGMDWLCPGFNQVLGQQLTKFHGNITAENTIREITAITQTGDLLVAIYNLGDMILHVANARADGKSGPLKAYDRPFSRVDLKALFAEQPPQ